MHKSQAVLMIFVVLALVSVAACTGSPETQVVIVVSPTHEPPTLTALAEEQQITNVPTPVPETPSAPPTPAETATPAETDTPEPETPTTPTATFTPSRTPSPTDSRFPTPLVAQIQVAEQAFENGRMFWLQPNREIWVMINAPGETDRGDWQIYEDTFVEGEPEYDPSITPPVGGIQPERGFGKLWRENDAVREALGWGVTPEFGFVTTYEYRAGGYLNSDGEFVPAPGIHILISLGNQAFAFEEADMTWRLIE